MKTTTAVVLLACAFAAGTAHAAGAARFPDEIPVMPPDKIINGHRIGIEKNPWQVAILTYRDASGRPYLCGGSLIDTKWILTAAHCFVATGDHCRPSQAATDDVAVYLGNAKYDVLTAVRGGIRHVFVHPKYCHLANNVEINDIALIELNRPVAATTKTKTISLYTGANPVEGTNLIISGWGVTEEKGRYQSQNLMAAYVPYVSNARCNGQDSYNGNILPSMLCAGGGKADTCRGDSGGPLVIADGNRDNLIGITSFGDGCGQERKYGVYTRISVFRPWIRDTISRN